MISNSVDAYITATMACGGLQAGPAKPLSTSPGEMVSPGDCPTFHWRLKGVLMIHPSLRKKLVREGRWSRVFEVEPNFFAYESKFEADGLSISVDELSADWNSWEDLEKLDFANAFRSKVEITNSDEKVLE